MQGLTGGFGVYLLFANNFLSWESAKRSYELLARYVMPYFRNSNLLRRESYNSAKAGHNDLQSDFNDAVDTATRSYKESQNE